MCMYVCICQYISAMVKSRGQRWICWNLISSALWVSEIKLRSCLGLYPLSHLTRIYINGCQRAHHIPRSCELPNMGAGTPNWVLMLKQQVLVINDLLYFVKFSINRRELVVICGCQIFFLFIYLSINIYFMKIYEHLK